MCCLWCFGVFVLFFLFPSHLCSSLTIALFKDPFQLHSGTVSSILPSFFSEFHPPHRDAPAQPKRRKVRRPRAKKRFTPTFPPPSDVDLSEHCQDAAALLSGILVEPVIEPAIEPDIRTPSGWTEVAPLQLVVSAVVTEAIGNVCVCNSLIYCLKKHIQLFRHSWRLLPSPPPDLVHYIVETEVFCQAPPPTRCEVAMKTIFRAICGRVLAKLFAWNVFEKSAFCCILNIRLDSMA